MKKFFKKNKRVILTTTLFLIVAIFGWGKVALAVTCAKDYIALQVAIPGLGWCVKGFPEYLQAIYNLFVSIAGILAVIMVMFGGFQWLLAGGNPSKITGAKATILSAMAGLTLLLASYTILNIINPRLTNLSLDTGTIKKEELNIEKAAGYCTREQKLIDGASGDKAKCGESYMVTSGTLECKGIACSFDNICMHSVQYYCANEMLLDKAIPQGFEAKVTIDRLYGLGKNAECGRIYLKKDKELILGSSCDGATNCVIDQAYSYEITKSFGASKDGDVVGKYNSFGCY